MNIIVIGPKGVGKSTIGKIIAGFIRQPAIETDEEIERLYAMSNHQEEATVLSCREIFRKHGADFFREREAEAVQHCAKLKNHVILTGGSTLLNNVSRELLCANNHVVYLTGDPVQVFKRATQRGLPPWLKDSGDPQAAYCEDFASKDILYRQCANTVADTRGKPPSEIAKTVVESLEQAGITA